MVKFRFVFLSGIFFALLTFSVYAQIGHWELLHPKNHPNSRLRHGMASIGTNKVLLFGGENDGIFLNDTWIYDLNKNEWDSIQCQDSPAPRRDFDMTQISETKVLLFGGSTDSSEYNSDLWIFDLDSMNWHKIIASNKTEGRYQHRIAKLNKSEVIVFGGMVLVGIITDYSNDTRVFNLDSNKWYKIKYTSSIDYDLQPRIGHMLCEFGEDSVLLYGGGNIGHWDQLYKTWLYSSKTGWDSLNPLNENIMLIFHGDMKLIKNGIFLLFGGDAQNDSTPNDFYEGTWIFDFNSRSWIQLNLLTHPFQRMYHKMAKIDTNKIIMFGGLIRAKSDSIPYFETWLFTLDSIPSAVTETETSQNMLLSVNQMAGSELQLNYVLEEAGQITISVFDMQGNQLYRETKASSEGGHTELITLPEASTGIYFLTLSTNYEVFTRKFVFVR